MCIIEKNKQDTNKTKRASKITKKQHLAKSFGSKSQVDLVITLLAIIAISSIYIPNTTMPNTPKNNTPNIIPDIPKHTTITHKSNPNM